MKRAFIAAALWFGCANHAFGMGSVVDVTIYDRSENRALPLHYHAGRHYVVGKPGNEYQVNIRNRQPGEILGVVSVDGVNAVSGETANWDQSGYVLAPHSAFGIKGWRKTLQRVAAFVFTEIENSYAARTGRPENVGVIGVAVFRRKPDPAAGINRDFRPRREASSLDAAGQGAAAQGAANEAVAGADAAAPAPVTVVPPPAAPEKKLGTGHGRSETSVVRHTTFERASDAPDEVITIYYDSYRNLVAQGVIVDAPRIARPNPFPGRFVPDPR